MEESILNTIKKILNIYEDCEDFDLDIIIHINSVFLILQQLGIGPVSGYSITDKYALWSDFFGEEDNRLEAVKSFMGLKVRLAFDPPASSSVSESMNNMIKELEWRLTVLHDEKEDENQNEL